MPINTSEGPLSSLSDIIIAISLPFEHVTADSFSKLSVYPNFLRIFSSLCSIKYSVNGYN